MALELACSNEGKRLVKLNPLTSTQKPATVDGIPVWSVVEGNGTVVPSADGLSAFVVSQDTLDPDPALNITRYKVTADADKGAGVVEISDEVILHVLSAQATSLGLSADEEVPK